VSDTRGSGPGAPAPGDPVRVRFRKWGGGDHWSADVVWLGEDEHGWWAGWLPGTRWTRPGMEFVSHGRQVGLFPRERGFAATFYEPVADYQYRLYVDVVTTPALEDAELSAVDLDLDVIERFDGGVFVDDEDEFALHQVALGYPGEVVAEAEAERDRLLREVGDGAAHFSEAVASHWRARLSELG
jgi:uncharacterized protein